MITERTLKKWRKEALVESKASMAMLDTRTGEVVVGRPELVGELSTRILRMTAELLDQHLIRKK